MYGTHTILIENCQYSKTLEGYEYIGTYATYKNI